MPNPKTCPNCGRPLTPVPDHDPQTAPWLCHPCARGWWGSELTSVARQAWDPITRSFNPLRRKRIESELVVEMAEAIARGSSRIPEHPPKGGKKDG